jgi:site-specific DNA recombinase
MVGEEASKGMQEKARSGIWPSCAPLGYQNTEGTDGKRTITPHPATAPAVAQLFAWFATGEFSLKALVLKSRENGLSLGTKHVNVSTVHGLLRKRIYSGSFEWDGEVYQGRYDPLITVDTWERVQDILNARHESRHRKVIHEFTYQGVGRCGHCGCSMVGELKKQRYVYYHCSKYKGNCPEPSPAWRSPNPPIAHRPPGP